ncbi:MAG: Asp-tRNA(Asn)/Glu-tRNA(Gln) amidotransferase subunit GatB [Minisyncoccia bacterium]|jgi:aspartyl-tRNA(Asn)/glutamyl-tRNA(Gln) amidotransferase subunit B
MSYEPTIGLEIHVELKTKTKMFCSCKNDPDEKHPNVNICPVCTAQPGVLPVINREAINKLLQVGLALNCTVADLSKFDRKNYFYPDLPKGYQISQYDLPLCKDGFLEIGNGKKIRIQRIHMEEDTGRLQHENKDGGTLVDFNRAGVPLMELVTHPDLETGEDVEKFAKELRLILRYLDASSADMEKGQMRVEVNISIKKPEHKELGTKVEIKNINSINAAARSVDFEIDRQSELLDDGKKIIQETRGWDENKQETFSQRLKEGSADYRYFPEPDLPPMRFVKDEIEEIRLGLPELPADRRVRFKKEYGLTDAQIEIFTIAKHFGDYFEEVSSEIDAWSKMKHQGLSEAEIEKETHAPGRLHSLAANYLITEFPPMMNAVGLEIDDLEGLKVTPEGFAELMVKIFHQELSSTGAKTVLKEMFETGLTPDEIIRNKNLSQVSDSGELQKAVEEVIAKNVKAVEDYRKGKKEVVKFLVGQVMALTRGKANPQIVEKLIIETIK